MCKECGCDAHLTLICPECGGRVILIDGHPKCLACEASPSLDAAQKASIPTLDLASTLKYVVPHKSAHLRHGHSH